MTLKNKEVDYAYELDLVRDIYIPFNLGQRLNIIRKRLIEKDSLPNNLVTAVSAVEGFSRSLLTHMEAPTLDDIKKSYEKHRRDTPDILIIAILALKGIDQSLIAEYFGEDTWELLKYAVGYRNLVVHECTYVGQDKAPSMIDACYEVLANLVGIAGLSEDSAQA